MPENKEVDATTQSAAEIYAEMSEEDKEATTTDDNDEVKAEINDESEESDATADEGETEDEDENEEEADEEEDLPLTSKLALDDNVREKFPEEAKRWDQHVKGLQRREKQLKENETGLNVWQQVDNDLCDPEKAPATLEKLIKASLKATGKSREELLGAPQATEDSDPQSKYGLTHASDDKVVDLLMKKVTGELGVDPDLLKDLKADRDRREAEKAESEWFDKNGGRITAKIEKTTTWKPTKEQILEARKKDPALFKTDPVQAVKNSNPDAYIASQLKPEKKGKDMHVTTTARGHVTPKDPSEYSARDAYADTAG